MQPLDLRFGSKQVVGYYSHSFMLTTTVDHRLLQI